MGMVPLGRRGGTGGRDGGKGGMGKGKGVGGGREHPAVWAGGGLWVRCCEGNDRGCGREGSVVCVRAPDCLLLFERSSSVSAA